MSDSSAPASENGGNGDLPSLPRTWRPFYARIILLGVAVALPIVAVGMWLLMPAAVRADFSAPQALTLLGFLLAVEVALLVVARTRLSVDDGGLTLVNAFVTRRLEWTEIVGCHLRPGDPWVRMDLDSGDTVSAMAIQNADGERGRAAARELVALVLANTRTERDD